MVDRQGSGRRPGGAAGEPPVLILGGTAEAAALARALAAGGWAAPILSLAGLTERGAGRGRGHAQRRLRRRRRAGGLPARARGVAAVVDATHPFAARITEHAARACAAAGVPRFRLQRPAWQLAAGRPLARGATLRGRAGLAATAGAARVRHARPPAPGGAGARRRRSPSSCAAIDAPAGSAGQRRLGRRAGRRSRSRPRSRCCAGTRSGPCSSRPAAAS